MTQPSADQAGPNPLEIIARQARAIEMLTQTQELMQQELRSLRRRVAALEGVPLPDQEPADPYEEPPEPD